MWLPNKKVDVYQEVQNLNKLVTDKRHNHKFTPSYLDIRKFPNWKKIQWENYNWERLKKTPQKHFDELNVMFERWRKVLPSYAKTTYKFKEAKVDNWKFFDVRSHLFRHDFMGGKVNSFKHYTQKNINLIR